MVSVATLRINRMSIGSRGQGASGVEQKVHQLIGWGVRDGRERIAARKFLRHLRTGIGIGDGLEVVTAIEELVVRPGRVEVHLVPADVEMVERGAHDLVVEHAVWGSCRRPGNSC